MKAMILAAGFGTRLGILSEQRPKPMLFVGNVPLIVYSINLLKKSGINEIIINTFHKGDILQKYLGNGEKFGVSISWSNEEGEILGTGGGVKKARDFFGNESFVVLNGKIVTNIPLDKYIKFHKSKNSLGTMILKPDANAGKWGSLGIDKNNIITSFLGKDKNNNDLKSAENMFTGIQILEPGFLDLLPEGKSCLVRNGYKPLFFNGENINGIVMNSNDYWWEHSTPSRYLQGNLNLFHKNIKVPVELKFGSRNYKNIEADEHNLILGENIEFNGKVNFKGKNIVGDNVKFVNDVTIENSIIWPNSIVKENIKSMIVTPPGSLFADLENGGGFTGPALK
jgi:mannose-1-phosphate guanylyltransferase